MSLSLKEYSKHVDAVIRGSELTPEAQASLRTVLGDLKISTEVCLDMFEHLRTHGSGDWAAQIEYIRTTLRRAGRFPG